MRKHFYKILFVSTIAVMVVFLIQTFTGLVRLEPLHGVTTETEKPKLTFQTYLDGSFQDGAERYLREHFGFREWLIRGYNQVLWSFFGESNNATVVRGKKGWLFEEVYVRDHYESSMYRYTNDTAEMRATFETEVLRLWKVQQLLEEHNIHIFVVINPGKDLIYPEYLPRNRSYFRPDGFHAYDYYTKRFDELGINYIDNVAVFQNIKDSVDYLLFPKTGTHWSNIASVYAFDSIVRYMETIGNQNLINLDVGERHCYKTRTPDDDMEQILNLAFPIRPHRNQYVDVRVTPDSTAVKPTFLSVGDSFYFNFFETIPLWEFFRNYSYWYYNSSVYDDSGHKTTLEFDIEQELMRHDYIMLIYNTNTLYEFSSYFLPRALLHLCYDKATIDSAANNIIKDFKSDPEFYAEVSRVAKERQISKEQVMYENVCYMLRTDPERFFDELQGMKMPVSRNKDLPSIRKALSSD